jgi:uncharacterized membrane protein YgcG
MSIRETGMDVLRENPDLVLVAILAGAVLLFILSRRARAPSSRSNAGGDGGGVFSPSDTGSSGDCGGDGGSD